MEFELICTTIDDLKETLFVFKKIGSENYYYISTVRTRIRIAGGFNGECEKTEDNAFDYSTEDEMLERYYYLVSYWPSDDILNIFSFDEYVKYIFDGPNVEQVINESALPGGLTGRESFQIKNVSSILRPLEKEMLLEYPKTSSLFQLK